MPGTGFARVAPSGAKSLARTMMPLAFSNHASDTRTLPKSRWTRDAVRTESAERATHASRARNAPDLCGDLTSAPVFMATSGLIGKPGELGTPTFASWRPAPEESTVYCRPFGGTLVPGRGANTTRDSLRIAFGSGNRDSDKSLHFPVTGLVSGYDIYVRGVGVSEPCVEEARVLAAITPIVLLSLCSGILLIGTVLYLYVYSVTRTRLYLATVIIGSLGILYTCIDMLVIVSGIRGLPRTGMEFHRIEALVVAYYMFALPYMFHHMLELTPALKRANRAIYSTTLVIAVFMTAWAFISPNEYLALSRVPGTVETPWNLGRGTPGILYRVRDFIIFALSMYTLALMVVEIRLTRKTRRAILLLAGLVIGISTGVTDLVLAVSERDTGLFTIRTFPLFCLGVTAFTVLAMISIMMLFLDQAKSVERMRKNEYLELLAGGIAHDFNNILTGVLANASLARATLPAAHGVYPLIEEIEKASLRAKILSGQLLTFSRGGVIEKSFVSLSGLIRDTVRFSMTGSNIDVQYALGEDILNAVVDVNQISQVIQNLAINAKQAMKEGGRLVVSADNVTLTGDSPVLFAGRYVRIRFQDTGTGIPENLLHSIFEPYFSTKPGGEGLGLAISFSIVKKHGGHIEAASRPNEGSTFTVYLPATDEKAPGEARPVAPPSCFSGRVLLMDDEELVLKIGANLLRHMGFEPVCVKRGEDAIDEFRRAREAGRPFRLIIMDLTITGGMGGVDTVVRIKELDPAAKVIVSTGYAHDLTVSEHTRFGFDGAIIKPYTFEEFRKAIEAVCA
ncbi:MAG: response regulator [Spirochaetes bacterium]|nr:MAG: response regulator [Spirochaetota bacterium]